MPEHVRDEVRIEVDVAERHLTIVECRAPWRTDMGAEWTRFPIARLRYTKATGVWSLYWRDRNLLFHAYDLVSATASIEELLRGGSRSHSDFLGLKLSPRRLCDPHCSIGD